MIAAMIAALIAALIVGCTAEPPPQPRPTPILAAEPTPIAPELDRLGELLLDRGGCERPCASDLTLVDDEGEVWHWGREHADPPGVRVGWVPRQRVGLLAAALVRGDYPSLWSSYDSRRSHARTLITAAVLDGRRKVVVDRGHEAPEVAQALVDGLTELLARVRWDPGPIEPGPAAAIAPACVDLRDRVAEACFALAVGEQTMERCRLYLRPAYAALAGDLPPALCEALAGSIDRSPPIAARRPRRGPACASYLHDLAHGCVADLQGAPIAAPESTCYGLLQVADLLDVPPQDGDTEGEAEAEALRVRADEYWCARWTEQQRRARAADYDPW